MVEQLLEIEDVGLVTEEGAELLAILLVEGSTLLHHLLALFLGPTLTTLTSLLHALAKLSLLGVLKGIDLLEEGLLKVHVVDDSSIDNGIHLTLSTHLATTTLTWLTLLLCEGTHAEAEHERGKEKNLLHRFCKF